MLLWLTTCHFAFAQVGAPLVGPEVTLHVKIVSSGAGRALVKQMQKDGFAEESFGTGGFFGDNEYPTKDEIAIQAGMLFPVNNKYLAKGILHYTQADVTGYANFYDYLNMKTTVFSVAALGLLPFQTKLINFRVGAGPAYHLVNGKLSYGDMVQADKDTRKLGFVLESGISNPVTTRFFFDLQLQYLYIGKGNFGSYTFTSRDFGGNPVSTMVDFSKTPLSSLSISLGGGYRFIKS